jgi:hypothetical protein
MILIGHLVLFVLCALSVYLLNRANKDTLGVSIFLASAAVGIFTLGGWALVTALVAGAAGSRVFPRPAD